MESERSSLQKIFPNVPRVKQVIIEDDAFTIHCCRYAAKSDFFSVLLTHDFAEKDLKKIKLHGIAPDVFQKVHKLLNTGTLEVNPEEAVPVYIACRYLLVKDIYLKDLQEFIVKNFDDLDTIYLLEYTFQNNDQLLDSVLAHLAPQVEMIHTSEDFKMLSVEVVAALVTDSRIKIANEDSICWAIASWLCHSYDRTMSVGRILCKIAPEKFHSSMQLDLPEENWNLKDIANELYSWIFEWQPKVPRKFNNEFFKPDQPLYVSNEDGILTLTHFDGQMWTQLNRPRTPIAASTVTSAACKQADLYVATQELLSDPFQVRANILHYNFRTDKIRTMKTPGGECIRGLHFVNDRLYSNTESIVQQYCAEHDVWLNPMDIGLTCYQFSASDGQYFYVAGQYENSECDTVHFYDHRWSEWIYFADVPRNYRAACGTFIGEDLYVAAIGCRGRRDWQFLKLDTRNCQWEEVMSCWARTAATPVSIRQCKELLVVMDHQQHTYIGPVNGKGQMRIFDHYRNYLKPVSSAN
ncbi:uncharacterized protein LOC135845837 [Planococcus citri]|uniref:uncharacterized protein LOC135845837 n=1 Tax=Planococcus citri TaxID=170843 RepID=UPI0031F80E92